MQSFFVSCFEGFQTPRLKNLGEAEKLKLHASFNFDTSPENATKLSHKHNLAEACCCETLLQPNIPAFSQSVSVSDQTLGKLTLLLVRDLVMNMEPWRSGASDRLSRKGERGSEDLQKHVPTRMPASA